MYAAYRHYNNSSSTVVQDAVIWLPLLFPRYFPHSYGLYILESDYSADVGTPSSICRQPLHSAIATQELYEILKRHPSPPLGTSTTLRPESQRQVRTDCPQTVIQDVTRFGHCLQGVSKFLQTALNTNTYFVWCLSAMFASEIHVVRLY